MNIVSLRVQTRVSLKSDGAEQGYGTWRANTHSSLNYCFYDSHNVEKTSWEGSQLQRQDGSKFFPLFILWCVSALHFTFHPVWLDGENSRMTYLC